eukprot:TRINITY_DN37631_c0_g1_i1.p1 TRINITY_DN37631_c0_g1~~TRINITY_DN37631_c0_g1_i1.p1  ORF type:complete len:335 (-),score=71.92 TRINITY_DN37631_c0_g1_i1:83-1087(-)
MKFTASGVLWRRQGAEVHCRFAVLLVASACGPVGAASAVAGAQLGGACPVRSTSLSDASRGILTTPTAPAAAATAAVAPGATFDVVFEPARFTCMSCDTTSCQGKALLCDLSQCTGKFLSVERMRSHACEPWWWCGRGPPGDEIGSPTGLLQERTAPRSRPRLRRARRTSVEGGHGSAVATSAALLEEASVAALPSPELLGLALKPGRFSCQRAALPPKTMDPVTFQAHPKGYVVLDLTSCQGSTFESKCYCWDNFKLLAGEDPLTSELFCDGTCSAGPCDGRTCGAVAPDRPPSVPAKTLDDAKAPVPLLRNSEETRVEEIDDSVVRVTAEPT